MLSADSSLLMNSSPATSAGGGRRGAQVCLSVAVCQPARAARYLQLLDVQLQPLAICVDDALLRRGRSLAEATMECRQRVRSLLLTWRTAPHQTGLTSSYSASSLSKDVAADAGGPFSSDVASGATGSVYLLETEEKTVDSPQPAELFLPVRRVPAPWTFVHRLCVSSLSVNLTVGTTQLMPLHVGTHRTPLRFQESFEPESHPTAKLEHQPPPPFMCSNLELLP